MSYSVDIDVLSNWDYSLRDAYGETTKVPDLVRLLTDKSLATAKRAASELAVRTLHQGYLCEVTSAVVSSVLSLSQDVGKGVRTALYRYLEHAAEETFESGRDEKVEAQVYDEWRTAVRSAFEASVSTLVEILRSGEPQGIRAAAAVLRHLDTCGNSVTTEFEKALAATSDAVTRSRIFVALGTTPSALELLEIAASKDRHDLVRVTTSLILAKYMGDNIDDDKLRYVLLPLTDDKLAALYAEVDSRMSYPFLFDQLYPALIEVRAERSVPLLLARLTSNVTPMQSHNIVRLILGLVLGPGPKMSGWSTTTHRGYVPLSVEYRVTDAGSLQPVQAPTCEQRQLLDQLRQVPGAHLAESNIWHLYGLGPAPPRH